MAKTIVEVVDGLSLDVLKNLAGETLIKRASEIEYIIESINGLARKDDLPSEIEESSAMRKSRAKAMKSSIGAYEEHKRELKSWGLWYPGYDICYEKAKRGLLTAQDSFPEVKIR
ncbi:hypothetical protein KA107_03365 [Candidatus Pacearchaeota archaeon]|nr:hypothetical protein [Candidatus Pacearchaeota archaeon]